MRKEKSIEELEEELRLRKEQQEEKLDTAPMNPQLKDILDEITKRLNRLIILNAVVAGLVVAWIALLFAL